MGLMASAWWCKGSCNVLGEAELSTNPSCGKGRLLEVCKLLQQLGPMDGCSPVGINSNNQRSGSMNAQGSPEPLVVHLVGASH